MRRDIKWPLLLLGVLVREKRLHKVTEKCRKRSLPYWLPNYLINEARHLDLSSHCLHQSSLKSPVKIHSQQGVASSPHIGHSLLNVSPAGLSKVSDPLSINM